MDPNGLTWTPTTTWTSATPTQPLNCADSLGVDPLEDPPAEAHLVDHLEEDPLEEENHLEEDPLEEDPLVEARLEDPLGPQMDHRERMFLRGHGDGSSS